MKVMHGPTMRHRFGFKLAAAIAGTAGLALLVFMVGTITVELHRINKSSREDLATTAHMVGANSSAAILFNDQTAANDILSALRAKTWIERGHLYDARRLLFASFNAEHDEAMESYEKGHGTPRPLNSASLHSFLGFTQDPEGHLQYVTEIKEGDSLIGYIHLVKSRGEFDLWWRQTLFISGGAAGTLLLIVLAIAFYLQRIISQPVQSLLSAMQHISQTGDYSERAKVSGQGEFAQLAAGFNTMLDRVEDTDRRLADYNLQLARDVTQRTSELTTALASAESANRAKSQFLANMSHEIRTPLNGVVGMLRLLDDSKMADSQSRYVHTALESSDSLLRVINDILDFSKIEAGKLTLEQKEFDLEQILERAVQLFSLPAHQRGLVLTCHIQNTLPRRVLGDRARVSQLISNFIANAVKFTEQGRVRVTARLDSEDQDSALVRIEVADTGPGLRPESRLHLFQAFSQLDSTSTRKHGGTGLGLAICRQLAELMNGSVGVESRHGEGARFWALLRLSKLSASSEPSQPVAKSERILVLEPDPERRAILADYLTRDGYRVEASSKLPSVHQLPYDAFVVSHSFMDWLENLSPGRRDPRSRVAVTYLFGDEATRQKIELNGFYALSQPYSRTEVCSMPSHAPAPAQNGAGTCVSEPEQTPGPQFGRVLIAEDNEVNQMVASAVMKGMGFTVQCVGNGHLATEAVEASAFRLVLMDCQMPEMDGYEATRQIRESEKLLGRPRIPIIALTAHALPGDRELCLAAGMDAYLTKPMDFDEARRVVMDVLAEPGTSSA